MIQILLLIVEISTLSFVSMFIIHYRERRSRSIIRSKSTIYYKKRKRELRDNDTRKIKSLSMKKKKNDYSSNSFTKINSFTTTNWNNKITCTLFFDGFANSLYFFPTTYQNHLINHTCIDVQYGRKKKKYHSCSMRMQLDINTIFQIILFSPKRFSPPWLQRTMQERSCFKGEIDLIYSPK